MEQQPKSPSSQDTSEQGFRCGLGGCLHPSEGPPPSREKPPPPPSTASLKPGGGRGGGEGPGTGLPRPSGCAAARRRLTRELRPPPRSLHSPWPLGSPQPHPCFCLRSRPLRGGGSVGERCLVREMGDRVWEGGRKAFARRNRYPVKSNY